MSEKTTIAPSLKPPAPARDADTAQPFFSPNSLIQLQPNQPATPPPGPPPPATAAPPAAPASPPPPAAGSAAPPAAGTDAPLTGSLLPPTGLRPTWLPGPLSSGDLPIDWFAMAQPYFNRGAPWMRLDANSGVQQQWMIGFDFARSLGFGTDASAWLSNKLTPAAIDFSLARDYPTRWELMSREMNVSPIMLPIPGLQFKLLVNQPADAAEQEADQMADAVVRGAGKSGSFFQPAARPAAVQATETTPDEGARVHQALQQQPEPLQPRTRTFFEQRFGQDFSAVRIHRGVQAEAATSALGARAFTKGTHIVFGPGQYQPETEQGQKLLAHELTHVLQQQSGGQQLVQRKKGVVEAGELEVISMLQAPADPKAALQKIKEIVTEPEVFLFVSGTSLLLLKGDDGAVLATYTIRPLSIPPLFFINLPDGSFVFLGLRAKEEVQDGKKVSSAEVVFHGKRPGTLTKEQQALYDILDADLNIPSWFGTDTKSLQDYFARTNNKVIALAFAPMSTEQAKGSTGGESPPTPPMPGWMGPYQEAMRKLIAEVKVKEPASADLPDTFYLYYSKQLSRWRAAARQAPLEAGKDPLTVYTDIEEKDDKSIRLQQIRDKIRIAQLRGPDARANPAAKPLDPELEWAYRLKLEVDQLIATERKSHPSSAQLPDKTGIVTTEEAPGVPYLKLSVYVTGTDAEGKVASSLQTGTLASPLRKGTKPEELFAIVRKATLALRGNDIKPTGGAPSKYEHILEAYPAQILSLNIRDDYRSVTGAELEVHMQLHQSAIEGNNLTHLTSLAYLGVYFTWDVYRISEVIPAETLAAMPADWKDRRAALQAWFKNSGQLRNANPVLKSGKADKILDPDTLRLYRNQGWSYGVKTRLDPDATVTMPAVPDDYVIFCRAQAEPSETSIRLPSEAFFSLRIEDGYDLAAEVRDERSKLLAELKEQLKTTTEDTARKKLEKQIADLETQEGQTLAVRTRSQLQDQNRIRGLAKKLLGFYQNNKKGIALTEILAADPDHEQLLQLYLMIETTDISLKPAEKLQQMIANIDASSKAMTELQNRMQAFSGDLQGYNILPAPAVGLVSKVTGQIYPLLLNLGVKQTAGGGTKVLLVDVTTKQTQESYSGSSDKKPDEGGTEAAVEAAFTDFGKECSYGEGYIAYRVPGSKAIGRVPSSPGPWQKVKSVLSVVAAVAGIAALIVGGIATGGTLWAAAAFYVGIGAAAIGAGLAIENIYDRAANHRLELDVELAMDILTIGGPILQAAGAMARLGKVASLKAVLEGGESAAATQKAITNIGALAQLQKYVRLERALMIMQKGDAVTNAVLIGYKTQKDLAAAAEAYASDPVKLRAVQAEIIKNAFIAGAFAVISLKNEFKLKDADQLDMLVSGALKEKAYLDHMIKSGLMDAQGNWLDPRIRALIEGPEGKALAKPGETEAGKPAQKELPEGKKPDETPKTKPEPPAPAKGAAETPAMTGKGGETFPEVLEPGQSHTFSDGAVARRNADGSLVITSKVGGSVGRKDYEDRMPGVGEMGLYGWVRAHSQGQGTGHENPYGILYAPHTVNEHYQNKGIEDFLRTLHQSLPADFEIHLTTVTTAHPGSARLAEIQYKVTIGRAGSQERVLALEASIKVANTTQNPRVTAEVTPYRIGDFISLEPDITGTRPAQVSEKNLGLVDPKALKVLRELNEVIANLKIKKNQGDKNADTHLKLLQQRVKELLQKPEDYLLITKEDIQVTKDAYPKDVLVTPDARSYLLRIHKKGKKPTNEQIKELILKAGNWKELMALVKQQQDPKLTDHIVAYRRKIELELMNRFDAAYIGKPSTEPESDVDLSTLGADAGANLIKAEARMKGEFGADWSQALRMNFYTSDRRLSLFEQQRAHISEEAARNFEQQVSRRSTEFNLAKMLHHARGNTAAEARVRSLIKTLMPGSETGIASLAQSLSGKNTARRDALHLETDKLMKQYNELDASDPKRAELAQKISLNQMEINFHTEEAYIGAGALKMAAEGHGKTLTANQRLESVLSNMEMMEHIIRQHQGQVLPAAREYELYKYMYRISESMHLPQTDLFFDHMTRQLYKINRDGAKAMTPGQALSFYHDFAAYVQRYLNDQKGLLQ